MTDEENKPKRNIRLHFRVTEEEAVVIKERMKRLGISGLGTYLRRMAISGYHITLDLSDVKELVSLLRRCSNNLNQIAKRTNETRSIYESDIKDLQQKYDTLWDMANNILSELAQI